MAIRNKCNLYLLRIAWTVAVNYASVLIWLSVNCGERRKKNENYTGWYREVVFRNLNSLGHCSHDIAFIPDLSTKGLNLGVLWSMPSGGSSYLIRALARQYQIEADVSHVTFVEVAWHGTARCVTRCPLVLQSICCNSPLDLGRRHVSTPSERGGEKKNVPGCKSLTVEVRNLKVSDQSVDTQWNREKHLAQLANQVFGLFGVYIRQTSCHQRPWTRWPH